MKTVKNYFTMFGCAFSTTVAFQLLIWWIVKVCDSQLNVVTCIISDVTFLAMACLVFKMIELQFLDK